MQKICSAPYGPSAEAKSARLTSWRATAARTVRVCAHLPRAFMHPGLGACVPCGASCSGGPALAYPISGGGASCHRPVPAASRFWARRDARSKGGVLSSAGGRTKQQQPRFDNPALSPQAEGDDLALSDGNASEAPRELKSKRTARVEDGDGKHAEATKQLRRPTPAQRAPASSKRTARAEGGDGKYAEAIEPLRRLTPAAKSTSVGHAS